MWLRWSIPPKEVDGISLAEIRGNPWRDNCWSVASNHVLWAFLDWVPCLCLKQFVMISLEFSILPLAADGRDILSIIVCTLSLIENKSPILFTYNACGGCYVPYLTKWQILRPSWLSPVTCNCSMHNIESQNTTTQKSWRNVARDPASATPKTSWRPRDAIRLLSQW